MAMTLLQGFSIREYAASMRSVDIDRCWPFDYDGGGAAEKSLPQITVKKFRFWCDELKSCEKGKGAEEIKSGFSPKGKQRNQKKRSIVELFAVAPPIDDDEIKAKKKALMKKERRKIKVEICSSKKGKANKPASSTHILHKLKGSVHKKLSGKRIRNPTDRGKKPLYIKNLAKNRKLKRLPSSKLKSKKQRERGKVLQAHYILKNPTRSTAKKAGAKTTTEGGEDDNLGHMNSCSHIDIPQLRSLCKIFSDVLAASSALGSAQKADNLPAAANMTQAENTSGKNVARNAVETRDGISSEKEPSSLAHSELVVNKSCSETERTSVSISMGQNQPMQSHNDADRFIPRTLTSIVSDRHLDEPRIQGSVHSESLTSHSDIQAKETSLNASDSQSLTTIGGCLSRSSATGSPSFIGNPQPPIDSCWKITELHPMHRHLSRDVMESMHSSVPPYMDKCIDLSFVGLPLNSQGELIGLQSGANLGFGEMGKSQKAIQGSIHSYSDPNYPEPRTNVDHLKISNGKFPGATLNQKYLSNLSQEQYFHVSKPAEYVNGFTNLRSFERFGVQSNDSLIDKDQILPHNPCTRGVSYHGTREDNRTQNYIDRVNFQPDGNMEHVFQSNIPQTMRLMGTNVTTGRMNKGCQRYDDGRIWTDKELVTDNCPPHWMKQQWVTHRSSSMPKNNSCHPLDASSNTRHIPAITPRSGISHFDFRPQWISRNGTSTNTRNNCSTNTRNNSFQVDFFNHPLNFQPLMNTTSNSMMTSIPMGHHIPMLASNPPRSYQRPCLNSTHCKHSPGMVYSAQPRFCPPIFYQESGSSIQPVAGQSSPTLPHWLLNANMQKKSQEYSCSCYTNEVTTHHQRGLVPTVFPLPSPNHTSMSSFPLYTAPIITQRNVVDKNSRSEKLNREGTNFNFTYLKSFDTSVKTRKRPAAKDDVFMKLAKKPFLRFQEDASASADVGDTSDSVKMAALNNSEIVNENGSLKNLFQSSSLKVDGGSRYGPIKLSAGAKHILKPSQDMDQDSSRPIHSTVPFSVANISGEVVKGAEIYRF